MRQRHWLPRGITSIRRGQRLVGDDEGPVRWCRPRGFGRAIAALTLLALAGCEVGPDFHPPTVPVDAGYVPGALPKVTASAPVDEGAPQRLVSGKDVAGQWWTTFGSRQLDDLVAQALIANPSLQAAQASLRQARENVYATQGALLP